MRLRDSVSWKEVDGEVILLDLEGSRYLSVNPSGTVLWPQLSAGTDEPSLVSTLVEHFGIDEAVAAADVATFVAWLRAESLVDDAPAPA